ncbi:MAG TPA: trypsin-like peptidase domain-containing protein [Mucilaginibacter sp.]|nr:trypsin-like peptidase domain-containing protein [Mucilaginibacter sp.]
MSKYVFCLFIAFLSLNLDGYCQSSVHKLEQTIDAAYKKVYPACVELFAYDTVARQQAGGQFSGVVVSKDGYILTAAHVATPGVVYKATFPDGSSCLVKGLGKIEFAEDKTRPDAAMLKIISAGSWPYAEMANSDALRTFEPCISLSYPEGLRQSKPILRFGYVLIAQNERGFVKSTCEMEPGDSGGPLFDYLGRLIGIHSAIEIPETDNYDVPVNIYRKYWDALKKPEVYTKLPEMTDEVSKDPFSRSIMTIPALKDGQFFKHTRDAYNNNCFFVESDTAGKKSTVAGTLFSLKKVATKHTMSCVIASKSSLVGEHPVILNKNEGKVNATVIARDKSTDLVLLMPETAIAGGIIYTPALEDSLKISAGVFLISAQPDRTGIVSISGSAPFSLPKITSGGFLGLGFKSKLAPLLVGYVFPNLNESIYKIKTGDEITGIGKDTVTDFESFLHLLTPYWAGDTVQVKIKREGHDFIETVVLDTLPQRHFNHPAEMFAGGKSMRRDGFNKVFTHDAIIKPYQCGGPVFDMNGDFYGLNIARYSRVSTLALPAIVVYAFIKDHLSTN